MPGDLLVDTTNETQAPAQPCVKFAILRLGRAAGKVKYTIMDEDDICLFERHVFEAQLRIDRNGTGAELFAWSHDTLNGRASGQYMQDRIWECNFGGLAPGFFVSHKNGNKMDNRKCNLYVCADATHAAQNTVFATENALNMNQGPHAALCPPSLKSHEDSLYYMTLERMEMDPIEEELVPLCQGNKVFDSDGTLIAEAATQMYFECHYAPCVRLEKHYQEFNVCGRCHITRYCSTMCQQRDWLRHKKVCCKHSCVRNKAPALEMGAGEELELDR